MKRDTLELEKRISTTNDAGLIALLLDKLIGNFKKSIEDIKEKDYDNMDDVNNHSRAIMTELLVQFSGDDEISLTLREVNHYVNKLMTEGEYLRDTGAFQTCIKVIEPIQEGFKELEIKELPKAVTGLTYGKNTLDDYSLKENKSFEG